MNNARIDHREALIIGGLTVAAFLTRIYGLNDSPLVGDEIPTVLYAEERSTSLVNPAYYILVLGSFSLFGVTEWSARLPSMLLGAISIPIFFITWRQVVGRNVALFGALFAIFSSWLLWQSQFSRFYSGVFLFGSLSFYFYYQALTLDSWRYLVWSLVANVVGVLFHVTSVMVIASCGAFSILILVFPRRLGKGYSKRVAGTYVGLYTLLGLIALPFLWGIAETRATRTARQWGDKPAEMVLQIVRRTQLPNAISAFFGIVLLIQENLSKGVYLGIGVAVPVAFLLLTSGLMNTHANYVMYSLPLLLLFAAYFCHLAGLGLSTYRYGYLALPFLVIILMLPSFVSHYTGKRTLDVRHAVKVVAEDFRPGDQIVTAVREFDYYARKMLHLDTNIARASFGAGNWKESLEPYTRQPGRVWIILDMYRDPLPKKFEQWLLRNGSLKWRQYEKRIDYAVHGYQVYLVEKETERLTINSE